MQLLADSDKMHVLMAGASTKTLIETCRKLAPYSRGITDDAEAEMLDLLRIAAAFAEDRNLVAHATWQRLSAPRTYYLWVSKYAPQPSKPKDRDPVSPTGRDGVFTVDDVNQMADMMALLVKRLEDFRYRVFPTQPVDLVPPRGWRMFPSLPTPDEPGDEDAT